MGETTKIKKLGTVRLADASLEGMRFEVHVPVEDVTEPLGRVFERCTEDYIKKYSNVEAVHYYMAEYR